MNTVKEDKELRAEQWIQQLRNTFKVNKIEMSYDNSVFVWSERFFWIGLTKEPGVDILPESIRQMLLLGKSPVLEFNVKQKRVRRKRTQEVVPPDILK